MEYRDGIEKEAEIERTEQRRATTQEHRFAPSDDVLAQSPPEKTLHDKDEIELQDWLKSFREALEEELELINAAPAEVPFSTRVKMRGPVCEALSLLRKIVSVR